MYILYKYHILVKTFLEEAFGSTHNVNYLILLIEIHNGYGRICE